MKTVHIQEFRALLERSTSIVAATHCGAVKVTRQAAIEWAESETSPMRVAYQEETPYFVDFGGTGGWITIGVPKNAFGAIRIEKQKGVA